MDIKSFLKIIYRYKWLFVVLPIVVVTITYFMVQNLPKQYSSEVQISTGLLDPSKKIITAENTDFFQVSQQVSSIIEKLKLKKIINILSYNLILHDLNNPKTSFRKYSSIIDSLNQKEKIEVSGLITQKLNSKSILTLSDNNGKFKLYDIIQSMGYGEETLKNEIDVTHKDNSDFINIEYTSENPNLSAFIVNTLASEFIRNYSSEVNINQFNSIVLLDSVLKQKEIKMNEKNDALSSFKRNKGVLNLDEQSASVYGQITQYEGQRADAIRQIQSSQGAISTIIGKLSGNDNYINGSSRSENREIVNLKRELKIASDAFIDNGFKPSDQRRVDSLNRIIVSKTNQNSDENVVDPRGSKAALISQKVQLEIAMQQARSSLNSIDQQLSLLRAKYSSMVPFDADIQNYQREADLATKDYTAALDQYNLNKQSSGTGLRLQIDQIGLPGNPEPSKKIFYLAGSGIGSFALCFVFVLIVFLLDNKIVTGQQLANATRSNTIGVLNKIEGNERNIREIWNDKNDNHSYELYRDMLRSLRFELSKNLEFDDSKILGVTSLGIGEGKTFISHSLAYAFAMTGKKVLLIADELLIIKSDSKALGIYQNFQTFLIKKQIQTEDLITIMNKNIARESLLETQSIQSLKTGFEVLKNEFDIIIIDVNSLRDINIAKEWLLFTEKNIAVFEYSKTVLESDKDLIDYIRKTSGFLGWILNKVEFKS